MRRIKPSVSKLKPNMNFNNLKLVRACLKKWRKKKHLWRQSYSNKPVRLETFKFWDEDDFEYEIFPILSSAHARTTVILAGKCGSRRLSTTSFSENVVVAKKSYQM